MRYLRRKKDGMVLPWSLSNSRLVGFEEIDVPTAKEIRQARPAPVKKKAAKKKSAASSNTTASKSTQKQEADVAAINADLGHLDGTNDS